jgi:HTH-type transcriptional regulator, sugar sensing transcriptional regulator
MMKKPSSANPLVDLGLTELESDIYAYLVENSPATGYRIAQKINKPRANAYEALRSLTEKGAVIVEDAGTQSFRALPPNEFLNQLDQRFQKSKARAAAALSKLKPAAADEKIYRLQSAAQVYQKLKAMLLKSETIVLLDLFPAAVDMIGDAVEETAARGVNVLVKLYRPTPLRRCRVVVAGDGEATMERWPGTWVNGIVDGREHLISLLSKNDGQALEAIWSGNAYLSIVYHSALYFEILHSALRENNAAQKIQLSRNYRQMAKLGAAQVPGYAVLMKRFGEKAVSSASIS